VSLSKSKCWIQTSVRICESVVFQSSLVPDFAVSGDEGEEQELHVDLDLDDDAQPQVEQLQPGLNADKLECLSVPSWFRLVLYGALLE